MNDLRTYDYELPSQLIAQQPLPHRADARLMVVRRGEASIEHFHVRDLPELLAAGDCLVLNDSRVLPARLIGYRTATGGRWEGLFLEADPQHVWKVLAKTRGRMATGESVTLQDPQGRDDLQLVLLQRLETGEWLMRAKAGQEPLEVLDRVGRVPLPPYIRGGEAQAGDDQRYQTVFARQAGSIAAPTAGLHFTSELLRRLSARGVAQATVTLHIGVATFRPITAQSVEGHRMHAEWCQVDEQAAGQINRCRHSGGRVVAVGSTAVRTLETAYDRGQLRPWTGNTQLYIRPPYRFEAVDALITNFHLPRTTLLVMVHCFGGDTLIRHAYQEAIAQRYRFYSYGDAMLIL
ncbi:MAG: tRNA preQ1(34) S-adenosylmethionine ribosyltransferase-isomerase QueA [Planctomycetales bacterium]|nr:tRNA preQ1(34) S-adenosylmethionine ribosyltransferase-isomerase QueA [Planctomycetales bacterium]NIM08084.1 tRNA preQ1(34) S-adenosylmethionine ribosyltransferase-isomerase QueA [Planctomycetales bacterium]NIN07575.1 tRNA preQ1(34) S-adenosylmethionine ribosyltransferase-isomerase QueA [Planctomycetales bacterium]NIN76686.1 tRNA preQ1(34) S-adenosylmethionine ribosyltransferase-isomerase QueA [Planctomycetales bacterium]NIO33874.1 tRNA preQ1(34) S-adenosylmethionine ribosyltransferase-isome